MTVIDKKKQGHQTMSHTVENKSKKSHIVVNISLLPFYMDASYKLHILEKVRSTYEGKAFRTFGIVLKVERLVSILKEEIMTMDGMLSFLVNVEILSYMPRVEDELDVKIDKILPHGIFITDKNLRIFLPITLCPHYSIEKDFTSVYAQNKNTMKIFRKDSMISVRLMEIRFENDSFSCIGTLP